MKNKKKLLTQLETVIREGGYTLRYEKGHFRAGYCTLEQERIVLVNQFLDLPARCDCLLSLLPGLNFDRAVMGAEARGLLDSLMHELELTKHSLFNPGGGT